MTPMATALLLYFLFVPVMWYPLFWLLGQVDGWGTLAQYYRLAGSLPTERRRMVSGGVGGLEVRGALEVAVQPEGLYVVPMLLFRPGHPPLLIPWDRVVAVYRNENFLVDKTRLLVAVPGSHEEIPITLPTRLLEPAYAVLPPVQAARFDLVIWGRVYLVRYGFALLGVAWFWVVMFSGWI